LPSSASIRRASTTNTRFQKLREAIQKLGIHYPVVMDEKQKIWSDYRCDLWPTQFVIDRRGMIRLSHGGVGRYDDIENAVRSALNEK
jgi:peroxiredoxin